MVGEGKFIFWRVCIVEDGLRRCRGVKFVFWVMIFYGFYFLFGVGTLVLDICFLGRRLEDCFLGILIFKFMLIYDLNLNKIKLIERG